MSISSRQLPAQHAGYFRARVAHENACVTHGFVVPLETRLDTPPVGELVLCILQLGCSYCTWAPRGHLKLYCAPLDLDLLFTHCSAEAL